MSGLPLITCKCGSIDIKPSCDYDPVEGMFMYRLHCNSCDARAQDKTPEGVTKKFRKIDAPAPRTDADANQVDMAAAAQKLREVADLLDAVAGRL